MRALAAPFLRHAGALAVLLATAPFLAGAQQTRMNVTGWPLAATSTTGAHFEAGAIVLGMTSITVDARTNNPPPGLSPRVTMVSVNCLPACPRTGTLPLAGLQWRRDDQSSWTTLTTTNTLIEQRQVTLNGANDPWSRNIEWRYALNWVSNPPTAATEFRVQFTLTVAAP